VLTQLSGPGALATVFFVLCKRHRFNKVPGRAVGIPFKFVYPSPRLNSDAGYAVLLLILLGAPVSIGRGPQPGWPYGLSLDSTALAPLPAQESMYPFGIIMIIIGEVAAWYSLRLTRPL